MKIIDFRCRPSTPEYAGAFRAPPMQHFAGKLNRPPLTPKGVEEYFDALDQAGIVKAICPGRDLESVSGRKQDNDYLASVAAMRPGQVIPFAGIDPHKGFLALREIERCVKELGFIGIHLDYGFKGTRPNSKVMYPVYEKCLELDVAVNLCMGMHPSPGIKLNCLHPSDVDDVATDFPALRIVCSHGGWPFIYEMMAVALRNDNVYFENSLNYHRPGNEVIVNAVNNHPPLAEKFVYATAAPLWPVKDTVDNFIKMGWKDEVLEQVFWTNGLRALNMTE